MICKNCGNDLSEDNSYCCYCGERQNEYKPAGQLRNSGRRWGIAIVALAVVLVTAFLVFADDHSDNGDTKSNPEQTASAEIVASRDNELKNDLPTVLAVDSIETGNISNGGRIIEVDNRVFYCDKDGIWTMTPELKEFDLVVDHSFVNSITYHGGWLYYNAGGIYKSPIDGSEQMCLSYDDAAYITVVDGLIYYVVYEDEIRRMRTDGTEEQTLGHVNTDGYPMNVADGWIYYIDTEQQAICRMRVDGTDVTILGNYNASFIMVYNGWVYFCDGLLKKMHTDGSNVTELGTECGDGFFGSAFNISDGWIFLADDGIRKISLDGSLTNRLTMLQATNIYTVGDWLYFSNDTGGLFRISPDGGEQFDQIA